VRQEGTETEEELEEAAAKASVGRWAKPTLPKIPRLRALNPANDFTKVFLMLIPSFRQLRLEEVMTKLNENA
jgi:hypothetical protein